MANIQHIIRENEIRLQTLHKRIHDEFKRKPHSPAHHSACKEFHDSYDVLAFPHGLSDAPQKLKQHDMWTIEAAVQFLEADPWFFRSGYIKEEVLRRLKHEILSDQQKARLTQLVRRSVTSGSGRVFRHYARLAPLLKPAILRRASDTLIKSDNVEVRRRAAHLNDMLKLKPIEP